MNWIPVEERLPEMTERRGPMMRSKVVQVLVSGSYEMEAHFAQISPDIVPEDTARWAIGPDGGPNFFVRPVTQSANAGASIIAAEVVDHWYAGEMVNRIWEGRPGISTSSSSLSWKWKIIPTDRGRKRFVERILENSH